MMHWTACILTLLFLFSEGSQVVARVRFTQTHYTVMEAGSICVDVVNDLSTVERFTVGFSYSVTLLGLQSQSGTSETRSSTVFFQAGQPSAQACITMHMVDTTPCEGDIIGTVRLLNNSEVSIGEPASATITIRDDDVITATFGKSMYIITEGFGSNNLVPFVNSSVPSNIAQLQLNTVLSESSYSSMVKRSIFFTGSVLTSPQHSQPLANIIRDDNIALEETEYIVLELLVVAADLCSLNVQPFNTTTIIVSDDDEVAIRLTRLNGHTREGEDYRVCISMSTMIARELIVNIEIQTGSADLIDINQVSDKIEVALRPYDSDLEECRDIPIIQDNVIEQDETFSMSLSLAQYLPGAVMGNLHIDSSPATITIKDTSTCFGHAVGATVTNSTIYVLSGRTLCFTCLSCFTVNISWSVRSFQGNAWRGLTGERLQSIHNLTDQGVIYTNGTLLVTNSSTLFTKETPGTVTFNELDVLNSSREYNILIGDAAAIVRLNISIEESRTYKIICHFKGIPRPKVKWVVNEVQVELDKDITITEKQDFFQSVLTLRNVTSVQYACRVSNTFGEDYSEGSIHLGNSTTMNSSKKLTAAICLVHALAILLFTLI